MNIYDNNLITVNKETKKGQTSHYVKDKDAKTATSSALVNRGSIPVILMPFLVVSKRMNVRHEAEKGEVQGQVDGSTMIEIMQ